MAPFACVPLHRGSNGLEIVIDTDAYTRSGQFIAATNIVLVEAMHSMDVDQQNKAITVVPLCFLHQDRGITARVLIAQTDTFPFCLPTYCIPGAVKYHCIFYDTPFWGVFITPPYLFFVSGFN